MVGLGNVKFQLYFLDMALSVIQTGTKCSANVNTSIHNWWHVFILTELLLLCIVESLSQKTVFIVDANIINMVRSNNSFSASWKQAEKLSSILSLLVTNVFFLAVKFLLHNRYITQYYMYINNYAHWFYVCISILGGKIVVKFKFGSHLKS